MIPNDDDQHEPQSPDESEKPTVRLKGMNSLALAQHLDPILDYLRRHKAADCVGAMVVLIRQDGDDLYPIFGSTFLSQAIPDLLREAADGIAEALAEQIAQQQQHEQEADQQDRPYLPPPSAN